MGMVFGQGTSLFDGKEKSNQTSLDSKTPDWFQGDLKSNSISSDQAQSSTSNAPRDRTIDIDDNSFDDWNDFKGSTIAQDVAQSSSDQTSGGLKSIHEEGSSADLSTHLDSVFGTGDFFEGKAVDSTISSHSTNWFQDDLWGSSTSKTVHHTEQSDENVGDNDEDDDSFGAWNDFKSSSVLNSSIDLSDHVDTVFASGKDLFDGKAKDSSNASDANKWFQDDLWSNFTSNLTQQAENLDETGNIMDSGTARVVHDPPSMGVDWFPDDQWLTGNLKASDAKPIDEPDDSFGDWFDF
ncbi:uncharacterized protein LOC120182757 isoform X1 [Hibiscus syriacus]|uniref:uncharacterized protein LOC120182757 isoform X1 n=1 Tax=Hibiscus syriacus TaxID=106335 RepID=UPI0019222312|nr:uncharacterized protein LOC120182757 isoform X1 [Hibiscus syriacus]